MDDAADVNIKIASKNQNPRKGIENEMPYRRLREYMDDLQKTKIPARGLKTELEVYVAATKAATSKNQNPRKGIEK